MNEKERWQLCPVCKSKLQFFYWDKKHSFTVKCSSKECDFIGRSVYGYYRAILNAYNWQHMKRIQKIES